MVCLSTDRSISRWHQGTGDPTPPRSAPPIGSAELDAIVRATAVLYSDYDGVIARVGVRANEFTTDELRRELSDQFEASLYDSVDMALQLLSHRADLADAEHVDSSAEYAARMANRGVPVYVILNMWRAAQEQLLDECFAAVEELDLAADMKLRVLRHMTHVLNRYVEWTETHLVTVYERERESWNRASGNLRYAMVQRVVAGREVDIAAFEIETGYRLDQFHIGLMVWTASKDIQPGFLGAVERALARLVPYAAPGQDPMFAAVDRSTAWAWLPRANQSEALLPEQIAPIFADVSESKVALGLPSPGFDGFRKTHRQARAARAIAETMNSSSERVVGFGDRGVALLSILTGEFAGDREALGDWVRSVLGPLAEGTETAERLRETVLLYLEEGCSLVATAARSHLHRNTVSYRVNRASMLRGRPVDDDRADLEIALRLAAFFPLKPE